MSDFPELWKAFQVANETGNPGPLLDLAEQLGWALERIVSGLDPKVGGVTLDRAGVVRVATEALKRAKGEQP